MALSSSVLLNRLRDLMISKIYFKDIIDAYIVPTTDPHQNKYVVDPYKRLKFISKFTGSNGTAVITDKEAILLTDDDYFLQAKQELDQTCWKLMCDQMNENYSIINWLARDLKKNSIVACDPQLVSIFDWKEWEKILLQSNIDLIPLEVNLIDLLWNDQRPSLSDTSISISISISNNELENSKESISEKLHQIRLNMDKSQVHHLIIHQMDVILWLFNLCLGNIQFNSVFLSFVIIGYNYVKIFIDLNKLSKSIHDYLQYEDVFVYPYDTFYNELKKMVESVDYNEKFCVSSTCNYAIQILISQKQFVIKDDIICRSKTIKDPFEIENDSDHDESIPWPRPGLLESPNTIKRQSNISSDIIIDSQTTTPTIDSIDVKAFGLNQKLFNIWFKDNIQQLKINEDNHDSIEDILFLYIDSNEDDNHIGKIIVPDYEEKITNVIFNKELNPHGYGYKQIIYDIIKDNMFIKLPYHPFETNVNKWVQQDYYTYGGQSRSLKVLLINGDAYNASKNKHVHSLWSEDNEKNKEFYTFYHGCLEHAAHSICLNGLGLHWNHPKGTDFGPGVYVTKNVFDALVIAERRTLSLISNESENRPACVVFQCPKDEFDRFLILKLHNNNNNINLTHDRPPIITMDITEDQMFEWPNFVHLCHHQRYPLPLVEDYDGIEGYVCNNIRQVQDNTHAPKCNLHTWQLCVRSVAFAKKFTSWITGIILLQIPDSSSTSSTTTVSHQK